MDTAAVKALFNEVIVSSVLLVTFLVISYLCNWRDLYYICMNLKVSKLIEKCSSTISQFFMSSSCAINSVGLFLYLQFFTHFLLALKI